MLDEDVQHGEDHDRRRKEVSAARPASSSGVRAGSARGATTSARARTSARRQLEPDAAAGGGGRIVPVRAADHEEEDEASPEDSYDMDGDDFIQDDDEALDEEIDVERDHEERAAPSSSTTGSTAGAGGVGVGVVLGGGGGGSTARSSRASASPPGSRPSSGEGRKGVTGGRGRRGHHQDRSSRAGRGRSYTRNKRMIPVAGELEDLPVAGTDLSNTPFIDRVLSPSGSPTLPVGGGRVQSPFLVDRITPAGIVASVPNKTSGARKKTGEGAVSCDEFAQPVKWSAQSSRGKIQPKDAERKNKEGGAGSRNRRLGAGHRAGSRSALGAPTTTSSSPEDDKIRSEVQDMEVLYGGSNPPASAQAEVARPDEASIRITPAAPETEQLEPPTAETAPAAASAVYSLDSGREMPSSAREEAHDESTQVLVLAEGEGDGDVVSRVTSHVVEEKLGPDGTSAAPPPESVAERAVFQVVEDQQAVQDVLLSSKGARMEEEKDDERARAEVSAEPAAAAPDVEETRQAEGAPATTEESSAPYQSVASRRAEANKRKAMARTRRSATVMMPPEGVMIDKESAPLPAAAPRTDGVDIVKDLLGGEHVAAEEHAGIAAAAQEQEGQLEVEESTQAVPAVDEVAPAAPPAAEIAETRSRVPASVPVPLEQDHGEVEAALLSSASAEQPEGREETEYQDDGPILGEEEDGVVEVSPAEADDDINDEILGRAYVEDKEQPAATVAPVAEKEQQLQKSKAASGSEEEQQDATHAVNVEARTEPQTAPQEQKQEQEVLGTEQDDAPVEEAPQASPSPASCAMLDTARSSIDTETQERAEVEEERKRARAFKEELGFQSSEIEVITDDGSSLRHGGI
ncbi:unnamed protein product [Amoebophrya sp. A25]|nr:unnamed protein product [Amoebophrya sp. A25]|eukprot:GSA25T00025440001.1